VRPVSGYKHWEGFVKPESASDRESPVSISNKKGKSLDFPFRHTDCFSYFASYSAGLAVVQPVPFKV
jgi:hypothetical protein